MNAAPTQDTPTLCVLDVEIDRTQEGPLGRLDGPTVSVQACDAVDEVIRRLDEDCPDAVILTITKETHASVAVIDAVRGHSMGSLVPVLVVDGGSAQKHPLLTTDGALEAGADGFFDHGTPANHIVATVAELLGIDLKITESTESVAEPAPTTAAPPNTAPETATGDPSDAEPADDGEVPSQEAADETLELDRDTLAAEDAPPRKAPEPTGRAQQRNEDTMLEVATVEVPTTPPPPEVVATTNSAAAPPEENAAAVEILKRSFQPQLASPRFDPARNPRQREAAGAENIVQKLRQARHEDYFTVLEVRKGSDLRAIELSYEKIRQHFDPAHVARPVSDRLHMELSEICDTLDDAFAVLSDPHLREDYLRAILAD